MKMQKDSLTKKMLIRLLKGLGIGTFIAFLLYFGGHEYLYAHWITSGYVSGSEQNYTSKLQKYADQNHISVSDYNYKKLKTWTEKEKADRLIIYRGNWLLFDSDYAGEIAAGAKKVSVQPWQSIYTVSFHDGKASVYIDTGQTKKYNYLLLAVSTVAGIAACLSIFAVGLHEDIEYIRRLQSEVSIISTGNLDKNVTVKKGNDELSQLARGLDQMRINLRETKRAEHEMKLAQDKLVEGMAHDLRTPLTGLMTYMEILRQQQKEGNVTEDFINKAMNKILQVRSLSDELFEYFQVTSPKDLTLEEPESIENIFGDYLSEVYSFLECKGFQIHAEKLIWKPVAVKINLDYIGRIFNNIISNLQKYANPKIPVIMRTRYAGMEAGIQIINGIYKNSSAKNGTGIGTKNIAHMMEQMKGHMEMRQQEDYFFMTLWFPVTENEIFQ